jgi:hypothetical protein
MTVRGMVMEADAGHGVVMEEGVRYHGQCDGRNHYLYKINKMAIKPKNGVALLERKDLCRTL